MAVEALVDAPSALLLQALEAVRSTPAPLGQVPSRLAVLAHAAAELQGVYLRELDAAERAGAHHAAGCRSAADLLVDAAGLPVSQARADAAQARRLGLVPGLLGALAGGGLEAPAARLVARAYAALPPDLRDDATAAALITLAGLLDLADLRAKVDELVSALAPDVTDDHLADARESGELTLTDVGAQGRFGGHTDVLTAEWLRDVLTAKAEADRGLADPRSSGQRLLDALLDCVRVAVDAGAVPCHDSAPPTLVVLTRPDDLQRTCDPHAARTSPDQALATLFDGAGRPGPAEPAGPATAGWDSRSRGGVRLGPRSLGAVACQAALTRLLLDTHGWPIDSSPTARQLSRRERRALEYRAGHRCERAGCGRPAAVCVPHHVVPWALGGLSTLANTVLLCRSCHHLLHDRDRTLLLVHDRRIGPRGWLRGSNDAPPGAPGPPLL